MGYNILIQQSESMKRNKKQMRNAKYSNSSQSSRLAKAMYGLSVLYELGIEGVQKDLAQSMYWLQRAACAGHNVAQRRLGEAYHWGDGVPQDFSLAFYWCHKAARRGDAEAAYCLGLAYLDGKGTKRDVNAAKFWFSKAAAQDYTDAQLALARLLLRGKTQTGYQEALLLLNRGADLGNTECLHGLELLTEMEEQGILWADL